MRCYPSAMNTPSERPPGSARTANNWVQATPGYAFSLFLCQWPGAPDPER